MKIPRFGLGDVPQIQQMIVASAQQYGVAPNIALGVASHESGFNPTAVNHNPNGTTDWGVMQLNDTTVQTMGVSEPLDPAQNIDAGVRLLANLLAKYGGDVYSALWAYASGSGNVGPDKTPNAIARNFIAYVTNYTPAMPIPAYPGSAAPPAVDDAGVSDASSISSDAADVTDGPPDTGTLVAIAIGLLGFGWFVSRIFD